MNAVIRALKVTNDDGEEQIVLPATKESAITSSSGERLDTKLAKMQRDIALGGGELPDGILYVPDASTAPETAPLLDADTLQGCKAEDFALKEDIPEAFDYVIPQDKELIFSGDNGAQIFSISQADNFLKLRVEIDNVWTNALTVRKTDGLVTIDRNTYIPREKEIFIGNRTKIIEENEQLVFKQDYGGYKASCYIDMFGNWRFIKNISAPNIATTATLAQTEQEITEMDLQNIETQQMLTEQDIIMATMQQQINNITV